MENKKFISLREFCFLKDPIENNKRDTLETCEHLSNCDRRGWSNGRDVVARYDIARENWERFGDDGPPIGTEVLILRSNYRATILGVLMRDPRFIELNYSRSDRRGQNKSRSLIIERTQWWAHICPVDSTYVTNDRPWQRWENITS